jgi:hypothetical protein
MLGFGKCFASEQERATQSLTAARLALSAIASAILGSDFTATPPLPWFLKKSA